MTAPLADYVSMVAAILGSDNNRRAAATKVLENVRNTQPEAFVTEIITQMRNASAPPELRQFSAIMLRQCVTSYYDAVWSKLPPSLQDNVKSTLLEILKSDDRLRRKASSVVGQLATKLVKAGQWNELLPAIVSLAQSPNNSHKESCYDILDILAEFSVDALVPSLPGFKAMLSAGLASTEQNVAIAALKAAASLIIALPPTHRTSMVDMTPLLFRSLEAACTASDDSHIRDALEVLIDFIRCQPSFLRSSLKLVVGNILAIANKNEFEWPTRCMAMEFMVTLAENGKGMARKLTPFVKSIVPLAFQFMLTLEHTDEWNRGEDNDDADQESYHTGVEAVARISMGLGGKMWLTEAGPIVQSFLASTNWLQRHAGLMALAKMSSACEKDLKSQLPVLLKGILPLLRDENPRVAWAAINLVAQFSADFAPDFQSQHVDRVIPALIDCMNPRSHPRVIQHASLCLVDFCLNVEAEGEEDVDANMAVLGRHCDALLGALMTLLSTSSDIRVQGNALTAACSIAKVIRHHFVKYYSTFMPLCKKILTEAKSHDLQVLRGKAMECVGLVGVAVGRDVFGADAKGILELLIETQKHGLAADDTSYHHLVTAITRVSQAVGPELIAPYLPFVIPPLLKTCAVDDAMVMLEEDDQSQPLKPGFERLTVDIRNMGKRVIVINTSLLEEQATACTCIYQYAMHLKGHFFPYIEEAVKIMAPMCRYVASEDVRTACVTTMPALLAACADGLRMRGEDQKFLVAQWEKMFEPLMEAVQVEVHMDACNGILCAIGECLNEIKVPLPREMIEFINFVLKELLEKQQDRVTKRDATTREEDFDEEEKERMESENESEDEFLQYIHFVITNMAPLCKEAYFESFDVNLFPLFAPMLAPNRSAGQRTAAMCVLTDIIEHCGTAPIRKYLEHYFPIILKYAGDEDVDVRHSALNAIGQCAVRAGPVFASGVAASLNACMKVIMSPDSRNEDNEAATDNAISTIARFIRFQTEELIRLGGDSHPNKLIPLWLSLLPVKKDEGETNYTVLLDLIESNNVALLGENMCNLPRVLTVLGQALGQRSADEASLLPEPVAERAVTVWKRIQTMLPPAVLAQLTGMLPADAKEHLAKYPAA